MALGCLVKAVEWRLWKMFRAVDTLRKCPQKGFRVRSLVIAVQWVLWTNLYRRTPFPQNGLRMRKIFIVICTFRNPLFLFLILELIFSFWILELRKDTFCTLLVNNKWFLKRMFYTEGKSFFMGTHSWNLKQNREIMLPKCSTILVLFAKNFGT